MLGAMNKSWHLVHYTLVHAVERDGGQRFWVYLSHQYINMISKAQSITVNNHSTGQC